MNLLVENMIEKSKKYNEYIGKITKSSSPVLITGLTFASKSFIVGNTILSLNKISNNGKKNIYYYILENELDIEKKKRDIEYFTQGLDIEILEFPKKDIRDFDIVSESLEIYIKRMQLFSKILDKKQDRLKKDVIVILSIEAMMQRLLPLNILMKNNISLKKEQDISLDLIIEKLVRMGYKREDIAENMGEFSVKGGILDISTEKEQGIRIEFWGDVITSIRTYSNISQKSLKEKEEVLILPLTEYIFEKNIEEIIISKDKEEKIVDIINDGILLSNRQIILRKNISAKYVLNLCENKENTYRDNNIIIKAEENSNFEVVIIFNENKSNFALDSIYVEAGKNAKVNLLYVFLGSGNQIIKHVTRVDEKAKVDIKGIYLLRKR